MKFGIGEAIPRVEDDRLISGRGQFVDDVALPKMVHACFVRSPHPHARILDIDIGQARNAPGVLLIVRHDDLDAAGVGALPSQLAELNRLKDSDPASWNIPKNPTLSSGIVRAVGEPIVAIVAETAAQAKDAAELVAIDFEPMPAVLGVKAAIAADAPRVFPERAGNVCIDASFGDRDRTDRAFTDAATIVSLELVNNRLAVASMEPRGAVGDYCAASGTFTLYAGLQGVARPRAVLAGDVFHVPENNVRVISRDVGGAFGMKSALYPEYVVVLWAAKCLGRPVKWISDRSEAFVSDSQARANVTTASLALDGDGRILGLRIDTLADLGACPGLMNPVVPHWIGPATATGAYAIPAMYHRVRTVFTNSVFVGPYRGAGRPESAYIIERLIDVAGRKTGLGPYEVRRRNFVTPAMMPWRAANGTVYDCGDFPELFEHALKLADIAGFEKRRAASRKNGLLRGIGVSSYIESAGGRPVDWGRLEVSPDQRVVLYVGTHNHGQGHETSFAQVVVEQLGVPFESVSIRCSDSDELKGGSGTHASRSMRVAGTIAIETARSVIAAGKTRVAVHIGCDESEVRFSDGYFRHVGSNVSFSLFEAAALPSLDGEPFPGLCAEHDYRSAGLTFPNGCHICELEIDPLTGEVTINSYVAIDDVGRVINPMIVEGQLHGGFAQGLGQALLEHCVFDEESGQLLSGSFMDYAMPRASDIPHVVSETYRSVAVNNPIGVKGAGEAGTTAAPPAIVNAVVDALSEFGVEHVDMPVTSERIWRLIAAGGAGR